MHNKLLCTLMLSVALLFPSHAEGKRKPKVPPKPVAIQDVVTLVANSLAQACHGNQDCSTLTSVDLTLHTELDQDYHLGVVIFGVDIGGHRENDTYTEFGMHLVPPSIQPADMRLPTDQKVADLLVKALQSYAIAGAAAQKGQYPLESTGFYLELGFTVTWGGSGDTSALTLVPIAPDISAKVDHKSAHVIRMTFGATS